MARKKNLLQFRGKTSDGKRLLGGVFKMVDTHGIPLDLVMDQLQSQDCMPDWMSFWKDAMKAGWTEKRTRIMLAAAIGDVYGKAFREGWEERLDTWLGKPPETKVKKE